MITNIELCAIVNIDMHYEFYTERKVTYKEKLLCRKEMTSLIDTYKVTYNICYLIWLRFGTFIKMKISDIYSRLCFVLRMYVIFIATRPTFEKPV